MPADVTRGKTAAECGYVRPDPRVTLSELRTHLGLAEGHLASVNRLLRTLTDQLEEQESADPRGYRVA